MRRKKLILCDAEADYAQQMAAFLEKDKDFPWEVAVYSAWQDAERDLAGGGSVERGVVGSGSVERGFMGNDSAERNYAGGGSAEKSVAGKNSGDILLVAESLIGEELPCVSSGQLVLLNESGVIRFPQVKQINKYQEAENVRKELLRIFARQETVVYPALQTEKETGIIGLYSPVRRCLQTGFSIACGQLLAEKGRILYLNFGYYAGLPQMEAQEPESDLGALMYYLDAEQNKFLLHMKSMIRTIGNWDYIAVMRNGTDLPGIGREDWLELIRRCQKLGEYDYIVLDLNESMQGLFDVLRLCGLIFTIGKEDAVSQYKLKKYEYVLERNGYQDVEEKSMRLILPRFERLPGTLEEYTRGELAEYAREIIRDRGL